MFGNSSNIAHRFVACGILVNSEIINRGIYFTYPPRAHAISHTYTVPRERENRENSSSQRVLFCKRRQKESPVRTCIMINETVQKLNENKHFLQQKRFLQTFWHKTFLLG